MELYRILETASMVLAIVGSALYVAEKIYDVSRSLNNIKFEIEAVKRDIAEMKEVIGKTDDRLYEATRGSDY
jgi:cell division protein FtsL